MDSQRFITVQSGILTGLDPWSAWPRSALYPSIPFRMIIFGPPGSGKTTLISEMLVGKSEVFNFGYSEAFLWGGPMGERYGESLPSLTNDYLREKSGEGDNPPSQVRRSDNRPNHWVAVFDDPPVTNTRVMRGIEEAFRTGRPHGISVICCVHSMADLQRKFPAVAANTNIVVITRQAAAQTSAASRRFWVTHLGEDIASAIEGFAGMEEYQYLWITRGQEIPYRYIRLTPRP